MSDDYSSCKYYAPAEYESIEYESIEYEWVQAGYEISMRKKNTRNETIPSIVTDSTMLLLYTDEGDVCSLTVRQCHAIRPRMV